jgi:hypothetical protein
MSGAIRFTFSAKRSIYIVEIVEAKADDVRSERARRVREISSYVGRAKNFFS